MSAASAVSISSFIAVKVTKPNSLWENMFLNWDNKFARCDRFLTLSFVEDLYGRSCWWPGTSKGIQLSATLQISLLKWGTCWWAGTSIGIQLSASLQITLLKWGTSICKTVSETSPKRLHFFKVISFRHERYGAWARPPITSLSLNCTLKTIMKWLSSAREAVLQFVIKLHSNCIGSLWAKLCHHSISLYNRLLQALRLPGLMSGAANSFEL